MKIEEVADAIDLLIPGAQYGLSIVDEELVIDWSDQRPQPTNAQITGKIEEAKTRRAWTALRAHRDSLLAGCDWTVLGDSPTSTAAWKTYRQALRDLPANTTDPFNPVWPTPPA